MAAPGERNLQGSADLHKRTENLLTPRIEEGKALFQSTAFLQTVIDAIPELTVVIDRDYHVLLANRAAREMVGGSDPVAACLTCYQLSHDRETPCDEEIEPCPLKQILETKQPVTVEHIHYDDKGNEVYVEMSAAPIFDESGEVIQIIQASRDITDRKRAEIALRDSEQRFRTVVEASKDAMVAINRDGKITIFNHAAEEMFGYGQGEMIDQEVDVLMPEQYRERHRRGRKAYFSTGEPTTFIGKTIELPALRSDGRVFPVEMSLSAARIGDEPLVLATIRDNTERKRTDEILRNEKDISEATLRSLPGIFYAFDDQGNFLRWNTNFEEVSGYSGSEILRMHPLDFIAPQDKKAIEDKIREVFATGQAIAEGGFLTREGREIPYYFTGVRCEIDGKKYLLGTGLDITERVVAEQALEMRMRQQAVVAELGHYALMSDDLADLMNEVTRRLTETLGVEYCNILELLPEGNSLLLRAGVGWKEGYIGSATVPGGQGSQAGFTLMSDEPVVVEDLRTETRFCGQPLLQEHGVVSGMCVLVPGQERPWGVLGAHSAQRKIFSKDDVNFLRAVANLLADAIARKRVEEALAASDRNYREVFDAVNDVIVVHDKQTGAVLDVNNTYCRTFGFTREEALQTAMGEFSLGEPPYTQEEAIRWVRKAATEGPQLFEWVSKKKSGELFWAEVSLKLATIGNEEHVLAVVRDISERKLAEESLQRSEQRFRSLVETTSDWIWEVDQDGIYTYASPKVKDLLGYEPEEVLGKTAFDFMPPDEAENVKELFSEIRESRRSFAQLENRNLRKDGRSIVLETSGVPIFDHDGNLVGYRGVDRDITERKVAAEELSKSEEKYRVLFEQSADATLIIDGHKFIDCNDAVVEMLRYRNKADLLTTHPSELSPETQPDGRASYEKVEEMMAIAFEKGSHRFEWDHKRADGEVFPVEVLLTAVPSADRKILHVVWRDITDRKHDEKERENLIAKLEAQNAELERFTYTVSHDLKSPLITLKGFMGLLKEDVAAANAEAIEDDMTRMANAADKMSQLLNELLELSRIGRVVNPPQDVAMAEIAREAVELVQGRITQEGMRVEIAADMPIVFGDRLRLVEVLQNLIENAVKWTVARPDSRIEIGARQDHHETVCYVRDNGMGINSRYHEKVFNLFEKLDPNSEGTGVGLALVKRIIEVHGGRIWVESEGLGQGATFCFTLPQRTDTAD